MLVDVVYNLSTYVPVIIEEYEVSPPSLCLNANFSHIKHKGASWISGK